MHPLVMVPRWYLVEMAVCVQEDFPESIHVLSCFFSKGHMPRITILKKYDLMQFADIAKATSEGNLRLLERTMAEHEGFFIKSGVYLILEKLKTITYRNLIKKV